MAFDGIVISNLRKELSDKLVGGRLYKIAQPEADELLITIKNAGNNYKLSISANASLPLIYLTETNKPSPLTAPNFCMLLRKHLGNGRITAITQPGLERIISIEVEHLDEMGDLRTKKIVCEFMGKYSNIIFLDGDTILDSIKRVSASMSSVREVLPGRTYFIPDSSNKLNPLETTKDAFISAIASKPMDLIKAIYSSYTGLSPSIAYEMALRAKLDCDIPANCVGEADLEKLYGSFDEIMKLVKEGEFSPSVYYEDGEPKDFSSISLSSYKEESHFDSISQLIIAYYAAKDKSSRMRQKSYDLRKIVSNHLERVYRKLDIQEKQLASTQKRDKYRIYGELINTYGYNIKEGSKSFKALNYYTNEEVEIPLDPDLSPREMSVKYFERYNKLKRTFEAESKLIVETKAEALHLESISTALDIAESEEDLADVKMELIDSGYVHSSLKNRKKSKNKPLHYISSDGFDIYIGKNNYQNDELTFKFASNADLWFHAKQMPGSHVILRTEGKSMDQVPDRAFEEAAALAAYYSKGREQKKVEVDYVIKKEVKKPAQAKPGFVVYYTNYSLIAEASTRNLSLVNDN